MWSFDNLWTSSNLGVREFGSFERFGGALNFLGGPLRILGELRAFSCFDFLGVSGNYGREPRFRLGYAAYNGALGLVSWRRRREAPIWKGSRFVAC